MSGGTLTEAEAPPGTPATDRARPRRPWSARRNAAALAALSAVAVAGALLYEEIRVRTGGRADPWRTWTTDQLAQRHLDDPWALTGSALLCALGLWLLVLAATPGLRRLLPLATPGGSGLRAALDRRAAAAMLRRAAIETPGVQQAGVTVGRRRARVRATVGFGDRREVNAALAEHLAAERERLGLVRPPMVTARIRAGR